MDEVNTLMDKIAEGFPEIVEPLSIGNTFLGMPMRGLAFAAP